jgi:type III pantothenate kinase
MMLLLDIGNTNLRWVCVDAGVLGDVAVVRHGGGAPLDLLADWERLEPPERIIASHVGADAVARAITQVAQAYWERGVDRVRTRAQFGSLRIAYAEPSRFGVDRWLGLIAARAMSPDATLILDAGTAATFDLVLADGQHLGGLILPGVEMMRTSLLSGTQIPRIEAEPSEGLWAADTAPAVAAGSLHAIAALASRLYDRLATQVQTAPRFVLTGGDAERLAPALDRPHERVPDLVLRGLLEVARADGVTGAE